MGFWKKQWPNKFILNLTDLYQQFPKVEDKKSRKMIFFFFTFFLTLHIKCTSSNSKSFGIRILERTYSRVRNKRTPTLINFLTFFQGLRPYSGLHRAYLSSISIRYKWGYAYSFCQILQGLRLFKGVRLFQTLEDV